MKEIGLTVLIIVVGGLLFMAAVPWLDYGLTSYYDWCAHVQHRPQGAKR